MFRLQLLVQSIGRAVGTNVGSIVGVVGTSVGDTVCVKLGEKVGFIVVGGRVGLTVLGLLVVCTVGFRVGCSVGGANVSV